MCVCVFEFDDQDDIYCQADTDEFKEEMDVWESFAMGELMDE